MAEIQSQAVQLLLVVVVRDGGASGAKVVLSPVEEEGGARSMLTCGASWSVFNSLHRTSWRYSHFLGRSGYRFLVSVQRFN